LKNHIKLAVLTIGLWWYFPSGGPGDIFVIYLISKLGFQRYCLLGAVWLILAYFLVDGKGISGKINTLKNEIKWIIGKVKR
jgi:hypothetical protein